MYTRKLHWAIVAAFAIKGTAVFAQNISVGESVPDFQLDKLGGGTLSPSDYSGAILFIYLFGYN